MTKTHHVPMRTCVVTRERKPKKELIRFVLEASGEISLDTTGKLRGRGANMTPTLEVFDEGLKRKALNRALKTNIPEKVWMRLREELQQYLKDNREKKIYRIKLENKDN
jgi:predicted RNA-binding protein YlxR (DUF448 family)